MLNERQTRILNLLGRNDLTSVNDLAALLNVSAVTIRQDLNFLESEGLVKRIHGGAMLEDADDLSNRLGFNYEKKLRIARKAADIVLEGETILIESGSANVLLARELAKRKGITIVTTNVFIARQFRQSDQANIILAGGVYQPSSESMVGMMTKSCLDQVSVDKAFIGIDGYTSEAGFMLKDLFRAEISGHIIKRSKDITIVTDSSKFGKSGLTSICAVSQIKRIATDEDLENRFREEFRMAGVDLLLA